MFPFARFPGVDLILGPEMKSTGEVMGLDSDFGRAFAKSQLGSGTELPLDGRVFVSVRDQRQGRRWSSRAGGSLELGFELVATGGTADLPARGRARRSSAVNKVLEGRPAHRRPDAVAARSSSSSTPPRARRRSPTASACGAPR